jgi:homoserine O-succinyltransferase
MDAAGLALGRLAPPATPWRPRLRIGLVNNMPDAALRATERQFGDLLRAAAGEAEIELVLFALPGVPRGAAARAGMAGRYADARQLPDAGLDGLIVTGAEPKAPRLDAEPYWPSLTAVAEWTRRAAAPTIWSCLAAHAAVLHFDGIERRRLPAKLSGVFAGAAVCGDLLEAGERVTTPHSRLNGLGEDDLVEAGYRIVTRSAAAGVDAFLRREGALALFLQGHPEYDADTLAREYARDVGRFLRGERPWHPPTPAGYFDDETAARLARLAERAGRAPSPAMSADYEAVLGAARPVRRWRSAGIRFYRRWLEEMRGAARPARRLDRAAS